MVRAVRDGSINRRLLFTLLAKAYGASFAQDAYNDAKEKAGQELTSRTKTGERQEGAV